MVIGLMGESGAGKSTSLMTLDPKSTMYFDCDKKGLSWKGWRNQYNSENKNYIKTDIPSVVSSCLVKINTQPAYKHIKTVVVDTINGLMVADEMRRAKEKGYDKWQDLAQSIYDLIDYALTCRDDLNIIFVAHTQTDHDDNGYMFTRIKTSGRKLDKICLESKFPVVLLAKCVDGKHLFETHANFSTAKTPLGSFEEDEINNDMQAVLTALAEY